MSRAVQRFLACWGNGDYGRLGLGLACASQALPTVCTALADMDVSSVATGGAHTVVTAGSSPQIPTCKKIAYACIHAAAGANQV